MKEERRKELEDYYEDLLRKDEMKWTTNRKVYKNYRMNKELRCSYCPGNRGCNSNRKWYGGWEHSEISNLNAENRITYPSWKLTTKKRKQWMKGHYKLKVKQSNRSILGTIYEVVFDLKRRNR